MMGSDAGLEKKNDISFSKPVNLKKTHERAHRTSHHIAQAGLYWAALTHLAVC